MGDENALGIMKGNDRVKMKLFMIVLLVEPDGTSHVLRVGGGSPKLIRLNYASIVKRLQEEQGAWMAGLYREGDWGNPIRLESKGWRDGGEKVAECVLPVLGFAFSKRE